MLLHDEGWEAIPADIKKWIAQCDAFFVENEKTTRRYFKQVWKEMVIDDYEWHTIHKAENEVKNKFLTAIRLGKTIGIVSEAGCPCIADPGQILVDAAQQLNTKIIPLVGPNSILMALMASGLNGQSFQFVGYLPIDSVERKKKIKELELYAANNKCTQMFIETPYRNNQLFKDILQSCKHETKLCVALDITASNESITTKPIAQWNNIQADFHKRQAIFLILA
jgi:16S rRNA (cytidine1402-2'-O)-methyltransferase